MRLLDGGGLVTRRELLGGAGAGLVLSVLPPDAHATGDLDSLIGEQMAAARIPGLAVGIASEGEVTFARGYGFADVEHRRPVTTETMFHIASITKTITAAVLMLLVEQGLIVLDEPVAPHLEFAIVGEHAPAITFRHLLMHTSGISDEVYYEVDFRNPGADSPVTLEALLHSYLAPGGRYSGAGNVKGLPGTHWEYSNIGYGLLGHLAGRITGEDMREFARDRLFRPLGLRHISWTIADTPERLRATPYEFVDDAAKPVEPVGFPDWSAGMIRASVNNLALLIGAVANGGAANGTRLLGGANNAEMVTMRKPTGLAEWLTGQGLAWQQSLLGGTPRINHWGGDPGVFTMAYLDPDRRIGAVILSNLSITPQSRDALRTIAARALDSVAG